MSQCGIGYLEGRLDLLEANPDNPGQALFNKLPRDKEGELRVPDKPSPFLAAILKGSSPSEALELAFEQDLDTLLAACKETWRLGNEAEDLGIDFQLAVLQLAGDVCDADFHTGIQGRSNWDNPTIDPDLSHIANIRFLVRNLWVAREWLGGGRRQLQKYKKAIGVFAYEVKGAVQEGSILVNRDKERERSPRVVAVQGRPS